MEFENANTGEAVNPVEHNQEIRAAKGAKTASSATKKVVGYEDDFYSTPTFSTEVYNNLPILLKEACIFSSPRENDMFLNAALSVASGCLFNYTGVYDNNIVYPNLYTFNCATAASGKGVQKHASIFARAYDAYLKENPIPDQPVKYLVIPANASIAAFINLLNENHGIGVINETELDVLANTISQEWGDISAILRSNFHHETVSSVRKLEDKYIRIDNSRFSMTMSGTFEQFYKIFTSSENGLLSRGAFYCFKEQPTFRDVRPNKDKPVYGEKVKQIAEKFCVLAHKINTGKYSFDLNEAHWDKLVAKYSHLMKEYGIKYGSGMGSSIRRLGLIEYKLAMILSAFTIGDNEIEGNVIQATDAAYNAASSIADTYLLHLEKFISSIPTEKVMINKHNRYRLLSVLPTDGEFSSTEAIMIGKELQMSERSVRNYLKQLVAEEHLVQESAYGKYRLN